MPMGKSGSAALYMGYPVCANTVLLACSSAKVPLDLPLHLFQTHPPLGHVE